MLCARKQTASKQQIRLKTQSWLKLLLKCGGIDTVDRLRAIQSRKTFLYETRAVRTAVGLANYLFTARFSLPCHGSLLSIFLSARRTPSEYWQSQCFRGNNPYSLQFMVFMAGGKTTCASSYRYIPTLYHHLSYCFQPVSSLMVRPSILILCRSCGYVYKDLEHPGEDCRPFNCE